MGRAARLLPVVARAYMLNGPDCVVVACGGRDAAGQRLTSPHGSGMDLSRRRGTDDPSAG